MNLRGLQGYAGHCAHVVGWEKRRRASRKWMGPLMKTRALFEKRGLPVEVVTGASSGTFDIDTELAGLTELQCGSYCAMDIDYRKIGGKGSRDSLDFEMALTVLATVVSVPALDRAIVDAGFESFSTDRPFVPEAVEWPGVGSRGRATSTAASPCSTPDCRPRLGDQIEFLPPHCDPTFNLYDRVHAMRGNRVEAVWDIAGRGAPSSSAPLSPAWSLSQTVRGSATRPKPPQPRMP